MFRYLSVIVFRCTQSCCILRLAWRSKRVDISDIARHPVSWQIPIVKYWSSAWLGVWDCGGNQWYCTSQVADVERSKTNRGSSFAGLNSLAPLWAPACGFFFLASPAPCEEWSQRCANIGGDASLWENSGASEAAAVQFEGSGGRAEKARRSMELCPTSPNLISLPCLSYYGMLWWIHTKPQSSRSHIIVFLSIFFLDFTIWRVLMLVKKKILTNTCVKSQAPKPQSSDQRLGV